MAVWETNGGYGTGAGLFGNIYQSDGSIVGFDACPLNCQSCTNTTNCISCNPNFKLESNGLCGCFEGFYLNSISGYICTSKSIILN